MTASFGNEQDPRQAGEGQVERPEPPFPAVQCGERGVYRKPELKRYGVLKSVAGSGSNPDLTW